MRLFNLLNELTLSVGIGGVTPDETESVTLLFDDEHEVTFLPDKNSDAVYFQCEVGDASQLRHDGCRVLLEASFSRANGAAFSIHTALQKIVLWKRFGEFASRAELEMAINDFLSQVVTWKQRLTMDDFHAEEAEDLLPPYMPGLTSNIIQV